MTDIRPIVYIPLERNVPSVVFYRLVNVLRQWPFMERPYDATDTAINAAILSFLETDYTHLVLLGMDHKHAPDVVHRLVKRVEEDPTRLIVGGLNVVRKLPFTPALFVKDADGDWCSVVDWEPGLTGPECLIGMGCTIFAREVFERVPWPWFYSDWSTLKPGEWPSMDTSFCKRALAAGIGIWCDITPIESPHLMETFVSTETFKTHRDASRAMRPKE